MTKETVQKARELSSFIHTRETLRNRYQNAVVRHKSATTDEERSEAAAEMACALTELQHPDLQEFRK